MLLWNESSLKRTSQLPIWMKRFKTQLYQQMQKKTQRFPNAPSSQWHKLQHFYKFFRDCAQCNQFSHWDAESLRVLTSQTSYRSALHSFNPRCIEVCRKGNPRRSMTIAFHFNLPRTAPNGSVHCKQNSVGQGFLACSLTFGLIVRKNTHLHGERWQPCLNQSPFVFLRFGRQHNWGELKSEKQASIIRKKASSFLQKKLSRIPMMAALQVTSITLSCLTSRHCSIHTLIGRAGLPEASYFPDQFL